jgi:hypothetical protein
LGFEQTFGGFFCRGSHVCPQRVHCHMVSVTVFLIFGMMRDLYHRTLANVY